MNKIVVTIQSCGGNKTKYRLGISIKDSLKIRDRKVVIRFKIGDISFETKTTCGQWYIDENGEIIFKKGFDLYSKEISDYIIKNNLHEYKKRKPNKIEIELNKV
jgi:hypothetical protein